MIVCQRPQSISKVCNQTTYYLLLLLLMQDISLCKRKVFFFQAAPAPREKTCGSGSIDLAKYFPPPQTTNVKKYKISKIIVFLTIKNCYFTQRRVTNVKFPYAFYLLGTGSGATYFYSSCSRLFFGAAPALVFSFKRLWL